MTRLFISDLHLAEERPHTTRAFLSFLAGPAARAEALYILGDLFEYWAGDDDADTPFNAGILDALSGLTGRGCSVYFLAGNRDFLIGEGFAARTGAHLLNDPSDVVLDGRPVLLMHGDTLCTDDEAYQAYRRQVREPAYIAAFLAQPLAARRAFIADLRRRSEASKREKEAEIMDVNGASVAGTLRTHGYPLLIHGHTHRPARHELEVDGHACERWVLSDWHDVAPYLAWEGGKLESRVFHPGD